MEAQLLMQNHSSALSRLSETDAYLMIGRKYSILILIVAVAGLFSIPVTAQSDITGSDVVERIVSESKGNIEINIPKNILNLIMSDQDSKKKSTGPVIKPGINKLIGYRIQVFSDGRNPHSLEARAKARGSAIIAKFPKYRGQIYSFSSAPNWYTRVGNFITSEEAAAALAELKSAFPGYSSQMRIVKSPIVIIK